MPQKFSNYQIAGKQLYKYIEDNISSITTTKQLVDFNKKIQKQLRALHINNGVYIEDPDTTFLSYDTKIAKNVTIEPNVYIGPKVEIDDNVVIKAFSYIEDVKISANAQIGPFARIRGTSIVSKNAKVGNFVEIKNSTIGVGSKTSHLSYIGDAKIGDNVNIGAGTITCNYDGSKKHVTTIEDNVFLGSNVTLIAPINIGTNSLIGAASFINKDVPKNSFAIGRTEQIVKKNKKVY